ncbi:hypothetical protein FDG94_gp071 [Pseudomonas phage SM1]|uniref:Tail fiber protein n=1 Tax=Pseudomonas phage SM1 TaxID=1772332 RepID=A0A0U3E1R2_9CAUD|nr:hypothetical protein FDG94_gp071 [Pseudomonas phage SM1]ALT58063.1 hypothetical protein SM1_071 [Pseudomonas phage SM1]
MSLAQRLSALAQAIAQDVKNIILNYRLKTDLYEEKTTAVTVAPSTFDQVKQARWLKATWAPSSASNGGVVAADFVDMIFNGANGSVTGGGHYVGRFTYLQAIGGGALDQGFLEEHRVGVRNSTTVNTVIGRKWVIDKNSEASGTIGKLALEVFDDMRADVSYVQRFTREFLDPRMVTLHAGGVIQTGVIIGDETTTVSIADYWSGKSVYLNSASNRTLSVPASITEGFSLKLIQGSLGGKWSITAPGRTILSNTGATATVNAYDIVTLKVYPGGIVWLEFEANPATSYDTSKVVPIINGGTGATSAAAARSNLFDTRLQNFSSLSGGVDQLPYQTGANTWAQTPLTSVGRGVLGGSTVANVLSYLGGVPKSLASNRTVSDPNTVPDECGFYSIGSSPWSNLPAGVDSLNPIGSMLYHHPYDAATAVQMLVVRTSNLMYFRRRAAGSWQAWNRVLSDTQLLGIVAQTGGVPVGSVIERGSNSNGQYVRFADGTQICIISLLGANDRTAGVGYTLTLPVSFTPDWTVGVSVSWVSHATNPSTYNGTRVAYANGNALTFILSENLTTNRLIFTCIGRWF